MAMRRTNNNQAGFTLVELLIVLSIVSLSLLIANSSYTTFREASVLNRAARVVAADVGLARSYAIRNRTSVALIATESNRSYIIRETGGGTTYLTRVFDNSSDMPIDVLNVQMPGDSIAFNERGLMSVFGTANVDVERNGAGRRVQVNAVGRWRVSTY